MQEFGLESVRSMCVPLNKDSSAPRMRLELARLWQDAAPTPEEFVQYLGDPA